MQKRYQRYTRNGIEWSQWFTVPENCEREKWQLRGKLLNEYRSLT